MTDDATTMYVAQVLDALKEAKRTGDMATRVALARQFPALATAKIEEIYEAALKVLEAERLDQAMSGMTFAGPAKPIKVSKALAATTDSDLEKALIDELTGSEGEKKLKDAHFGKELKTQPRIMPDGTVVRPRGRPPREEHPVFVDEVPGQAQIELPADAGTTLPAPRPEPSHDPIVFDDDLEKELEQPEEVDEEDEDEEEDEETKAQEAARRKRVPRRLAEAANDEEVIDPKIANLFKKPKN